MEKDDRAKLASRRLGDAITAAAQESDAVRDAMRELREMGYVATLSYHVDLLPVQSEAEAEDPIAEDFTEDDRKALRRMLIRVR